MLRSKKVGDVAVHFVSEISKYTIVQTYDPRSSFQVWKLPASALPLEACHRGMTTGGYNRTYGQGVYIADNILAGCHTSQGYRLIILHRVVALHRILLFINSAKTPSKPIENIVDLSESVTR